MVKTKVQALILAGMLIFGVSQAAMADMLSLGVSVPVKQDFKADDAEDVKSTSGFMLEVQLPVMVGLAYESYESKLDTSDEPTINDFSITTTMYDIFYTLDLSLVSFTLGAGVGETAVKGDLEKYFKKGKASQFFWRIGVPVMPLFSIHAGQHNVKSKIEGEEGVSMEMDVDSTVTVLGVSVGF